jgi:hypothetical protein
VKAKDRTSIDEPQIKHLTKEVNNMENTIILGNGNIGMFPTILKEAPSRIDGCVSLVFVDLPIVKPIGEFSSADECGFAGDLDLRDERIKGIHVFYNVESIDNLIDALNDTKKLFETKTDA